MHTTVSTGGTPQGVGCDRAAMRTSQRRRLRRTRCRTSSQVRAGACWVRVGGSRFLQTDPIPGGSANDYDYSAQDPVNNTDLDGRSYQSEGPCSTAEMCYGHGSRADYLAANPYVQAANMSAYRHSITGHMVHAVAKHHAAVGNFVGTWAGYASFVPIVGGPMAYVSEAGYVAAGNWKEARAGAVGLLAGFGGGRLLAKAATATIGFRNGARVRRLMHGYEYVRGVAYGLASTG